MTYRKKYARASMTVFMGMTILLILSIFFSLLEVVHFYSLKKESLMVSDIGAESMFADYCRPLWKEYGILAIDLGYGGDSPDRDMAAMRMLDYLGVNLSVSQNASAGNHLNMMPAACEINSYGLLTDNNGGAFVKEAAKTVMYGIPQELFDKISDGGEHLSFVDFSWQDLLEKGEEAKQRAAERLSDDEADAISEAYDGGSLEDDPIEAVLDHISESILSQAVPADNISNKVMRVSNKISERNLYSGNDEAVSSGVSDKLLFQAYLTDRFGCFTNPKNRKGLEYELEYMISNEDSDRDNLAETAEKLLAFRGAMNYTAIMSMHEKLSEADILSEFMGGALLPQAQPAIRSGIIAAWVYAESIMDVRTLMSGGKISVIKNRTEWTSGLSNIVSILNGTAKSSNCEKGYDYRTYLGIMLTLSPARVLSSRALEVIEDELRSRENYKNVRLDCFIYSANIDFTYGAAPIFGNLVKAQNTPDGYAFKETRKMNYLK